MRHCNAIRHSDAAIDKMETIGYGEDVEDFGGLLATFRQQSGLSQNALARRAGVNPGTVNRLESGQRAPTNRDLVLLLADALGLDTTERDRLLAAAGHLPLAFGGAAAADPTLRLVADILGDDSIPERERREFRRIIGLVARRWRPDADDEPGELEAETSPDDDPPADDDGRPDDPDSGAGGWNGE